MFHKDASNLDAVALNLKVASFSSFIETFKAGNNRMTFAPPGTVNIL
jgi:hypothetical protein